MPDTEASVIDGFDSNLASVVEAWPALPEAVRVGIVAIVRAAAAKTDDYGLERR